MSNFDIPQSLGTAESYGVKGEYRTGHKSYCDLMIGTHVHISYCQKIRYL